MLRVAVFVIALLLAAGAVQPEPSWFIALAALAGVRTFLRPAHDLLPIRAMPLTVFIIALLLATEALEPSGAWLVTLAVLSGIDLTPWRPFRFARRARRAWVRADFDW